MLLHELSDMRRPLVRGLQYLSHDRDFDRQRCASNVGIISDSRLRRAAESYEIGLGDRLVYSLLTMVLLKLEGSLDRFMLEKMQSGIRHLTISFETVENVAIVREAMTKPKVEECFCASLKLWRTRDAGDAVLKLRIEILPKLRI